MSYACYIVSMNTQIKEQIEEAIAKRKRAYVTAADVAAVVCKESHAVPYFSTTDPLYKANLRAASAITGLTQVALKSALIIASGPYKGKIAKFRCEPGYWSWAKKQKFTPIDQFLLSCSFGVGQKMTRYYVYGTPQSKWISSIRKLMAQVELQLLYVAGDLDKLLVGTKGNRALAFTRYNAGPSATAKSPAYKAYGLPVAAMAKQFAAGIDVCEHLRSLSITYLNRMVEYSHRILETRLA